MINEIKDVEIITWSVTETSRTLDRHRLPEWRVTKNTQFSSPQIRVSAEQGGRGAENENLSPILRQTKR